MSSRSADPWFSSLTIFFPMWNEEAYVERAIVAARSICERMVLDGVIGDYELIIVDELGFAPLDDTGAQLLFRFVAAAYERRSLGLASHWPFESWGRFLPEHTTAVSMLDRLLHHCHVVITDGESYRMRQARNQGGTKINKN